MSAFMTMNRTTQFTNGLNKPGLRDRAVAALKSFGHEFRRAMRVIATRPDVSRLDDRMLQDLGISRAQADFEASRAPWKLR
jgi:uncharacterized protein YjiS (DUF1127 family)